MKCYEHCRFILLLIVLVLMTCTADQAQAVEGEVVNSMALSESLDKEKTYSILFIGNSYTYYNDMPSQIFKPIAESAGYKVDVSSITKGAHTLAKFADPSDTYGAKVEAALSGTKKYDFVVIQEQSTLPATENVANFYDAVRNLAKRIRATGAKPILYSTWGRKTGSSTLTTYGWTNETMTWKIAAAYRAIGEELDIPVVYVGIAFRDVYSNYSNIELYNSDKSHPSYTGSYLSASTLFTGIFGVDPSSVTYTGKISSDNAKILLEAANTAVFETPDIPEDYATLSGGVSNLDFDITNVNVVKKASGEEDYKFSVKVNMIAKNNENVNTPKLYATVYDETGKTLLYIKSINITDGMTEYTFDFEDALENKNTYQVKVMMLSSTLTPLADCFCQTVQF